MKKENEPSLLYISFIIFFIEIFYIFHVSLRDKHRFINFCFSDSFSYSYFFAILLLCCHFLNNLIFHLLFLNFLLFSSFSLSRFVSPVFSFLPLHIFVSSNRIYVRN